MSYREYYELNLNNNCYDVITLETTTILEALKDPDNLIFVSIDNVLTKTPYSEVIRRDTFQSFTIDNRIECQEIGEEPDQYIYIGNRISVLRYIDFSLFNYIKNQIENNLFFTKIFVFKRNLTLNTNCSEEIKNQIYTPVIFSIVVEPLEDEPLEDEPLERNNKKTRIEPPMPPTSVNNVLSLSASSRIGGKYYSRKNKIK